MRWVLDRGSASTFLRGADSRTIVRRLRRQMRKLRARFAPKSSHVKPSDALRVALEAVTRWKERHRSPDPGDLGAIAGLEAWVTLERVRRGESTAEEEYEDLLDTDAEVDSWMSATAGEEEYEPDDDRDVFFGEWLFMRDYLLDYLEEDVFYPDSPSSFGPAAERLRRERRAVE